VSRAPGGRDGGAVPPGTVYLEFTPVGRQVKVSAIDAGTGTEVSIVGPLGAARADLERLALAKLKARLARER